MNQVSDGCCLLRLRTRSVTLTCSRREFRESFQGVQKRGMQQDLSWDHAAEQYENILVAGEAAQRLLPSIWSLDRLY